MTIERIGRYRVTGELGRGGFATVFLAEDPSLDDQVAIKVLSEAHSSQSEIVARFVAEARVMRTLAAPGLVAVHDSGEVEGRPYFVMEYCQRGSVAERLWQVGRPLTMDEGLGLANAISLAMAGAHRGHPPVVHRDLKPANLLLRATRHHGRPPVGDLIGSDEELIVGDFGLAKIVTGQATALSLLAFTRGYAAPEQIRGDPTIGPSADVYSASAIVLAALAGCQPEQVFAPTDRAFDDAALANAGRLRPELERGLSYDRHHRQADLVEWWQALDRARWARPSPAPPGPAPFIPEPPSPTPPPPTPFSVTPAAVIQPLQAPAPQPTPTPDGSNAVGETPTPPGSEELSPRRRRRPLRATLLAVVVAGALAMWWSGLGGPSILGPTEGRVGDEVAFAVLDAAVERWEVGGQTSTDPVLLFTPRSAGLVVIEVATGNGRSTVEFRAVDRGTTPTIEGSGLLPLGESTELSVADGGDAGVAWVVNGRPHAESALVLKPTTAGLVEVVVTTDDGGQAHRTFTAAPGSTP